MLLEPMNIPPKAEGAFRVIHTADWHLGKMLCDKPRHEEHQRFLEFLLSVIQDNAVDALLVAGDVFDSGNPPQSAVAIYFDFLSRLHKETDCAAVVTAGNHDAPSHLEAPRQVLKALNVHVVGQWPNDPTNAVIFLPSAEQPLLTIAAVPYLRDRDLRTGRAMQTREEIERDLREGIQRCYAGVAEAIEQAGRPGVAALALGHLTVVGGVTSDSEREIHVGGLGAVSHACFPQAFQYVALGHLHRPQSVGGLDHIRYAGAPIPLSFSEADHAKSLRLLDFADGQLVRNEEIAIPAARRLLRVEAPFHQLAERLKDLTPPTEPLAPWLEVAVIDPPPGENISDQVTQWLEGSTCELLKVTISRSAASHGLSLAEESLEEDAQNLLSDPARVFERRLADCRAEPFTDEDREQLQLAFRQLLQLHHENESEAPPPSDNGGAR